MQTQNDIKSCSLRKLNQKWFRQMLKIRTFKKTNYMQIKMLQKPVSFFIVVNSFFFLLDFLFPLTFFVRPMLPFSFEEAE